MRLNALAISGKRKASPFWSSVYILQPSHDSGGPGDFVESGWWHPMRLQDTEGIERPGTRHQDLGDVNICAEVTGQPDSKYIFIAMRCSTPGMGCGGS